MELASLAANRHFIWLILILLRFSHRVNSDSASFLTHQPLMTTNNSSSVVSTTLLPSTTTYKDQRIEADIIKLTNILDYTIRYTPELGRYFNINDTNATTYHKKDIESTTNTANANHARRFHIRWRRQVSDKRNSNEGPGDPLQRWLLDKFQMPAQKGQDPEYVTNQCLQSEKMVAKVIEHNLPSSLNELERICDNTQFLLNVCWQQPNSNNNNPTSSATKTGTSTNTGGALPMVHYESILTPVIKERIYWISMNLCIDQEFKRDYVENVQCLSKWSKYQQQSTCAIEYERIIRVVSHQQSNNNNNNNNNQTTDNQINNPVHTNHNQGQHQHPSRGPQGLIAQATSQNGHQAKDDTQKALESGRDSDLGASSPESSSLPTGSRTNQELMEGDLELRTLCCSFDVFLKCISAQAARDCGQPASKFVVRFFGKLAGEDVRIHCNKYNYMGGIGSQPKLAPPPSAAATGPQSIINTGFCNELKYNQQRMANNNNNKNGSNHHGGDQINRDMQHQQQYNDTVHYNSDNSGSSRRTGQQNPHQRQRQRPYHSNNVYHKQQQQQHNGSSTSQRQQQPVNSAVTNILVEPFILWPSQVFSLLVTILLLRSKITL